MGRAPLDIGKPGNITIRELAPRTYQARCRFRDLDGVTRLIAAQGKSRTAAQNALLAKLKDRAGAGELADLKPHSRFADAAALWLTQIQQTQRGTTYDNYRRWLTGRVLPDIGEMRLRELRVGYLDAYFTRLKVQHGYQANTLRMIRKVVRGPLELAVKHEALSANPVSHISKISGKSDEPRALTPEEHRRLRNWLNGASDDPRERAAQELARRRDLPDIVRVMLGTGLRVGELAALRWRDVNLDGAPVVVNGEPALMPTCTVAGTVVRITGTGLVMHPGKTDSARRTFPLPQFVVDVLRARQQRLGSLAKAGDVPVFCVMGRHGPTWRDPDKIGAALREVRHWVGLEWMTTHTWRKTAATMMDEAGLSARGIADQMGHRHVSMTQNVYMGRGVVNVSAAAALDAALADD